MKKVAIYLRVSTDSQTTENQRRELDAVAARSGWQVVRVYEDAGISGAKGRDKRPGLDAMMKAVNAKEFQMVAAWSVDRLGRSLTDLLAILQALHDKGVDLFLHQQPGHLDDGRPRNVSNAGRLRRVRTGHHPRTCQRRACARQGEGHDAGASSHGARGREAHTRPPRQGHGRSQDRSHLGSWHQRRSARRRREVKTSRRACELWTNRRGNPRCSANVAPDHTHVVETVEKLEPRLGF
jgi:Resolvase, N terminal domain